MINKILVKILIRKEVILNKKIRNYKCLNMEMDFENIFIFYHYI